MKNKIILGLSLVVSTIVLTGCVAKPAKLVCTQTTSGVDITFNVDFKGKTIKNMDFSYDMDLSKYSDAQIKAVGKQDFCTRVKNSMIGFKDAFTDCNQSIEDKHLKVASKMDIDKIAKNYLEKMTTPEAAKKQLEASGYKCTIEKK